MDRADINRQIVIDFMKTDNKGYSIGEIVRHLMDDLLYISEISGRVSIGKLLKKLEEENIVYHKVAEPKRGVIQVKIWYVKDGLQKIPAQE